MTNEIAVQTIKTVAEVDAKLFVEEFPGETLGGSDWDSEAWACVSSDGYVAGVSVREAIEALGEIAAWESYRAHLSAQIDLLAK